MRIAYFPSWFPTLKDPTAGIFFVDQVELLSKASEIEKIYVFNIREGSREKFLKNDIFNSEKIELINIALPRIGPQLRFFIAPIILLLIWRKIKILGNINVIHAQSIYAGFYAYWASIIFSKKLILTEHASIVHDKNLGFFYTLQLKLISRRAKKIIAVSNSLKRSLNSYGVDNVYVIHNPVNIPLITEPPKYADREIDIITIGRLEPVKGQYDFLKRLAQCEFEKVLNVVLIGDGSEYEKISNIESKTLNIRINKFVPHNQIKDILDNSKLYACTSYSETFGLAVAEAILRGVPIITRNNGGIEDLLKYSHSYEVDNDLAAVALRLFEKKSESTLQYQAPANNPFSAANFIKKHINLYHNG